MKLSQRLQHIEQMVTSDYTHIWDCCCDHGFLGASLLNRQAAKHIHFVDIIPELMENIENKLQQFYSNSPSAWKTHCLDVAELPLKQYEGKHLIIIAGVGGDLMIRFIHEIYQKYPHLKLDFLLCPVHHQFALREKLISLNFSLNHEVLVEENRRFYEVMLVSSASNENKVISLVGNKIWQSETTKQAEIVEKYLAKTLNHYRRIQQGSTSNVDHIIRAYLAVITNSKH